MTIEYLQLLFDFGLVVLIWMVQLIVYPSFLRYAEVNLFKWHAIYVQRISYVVIPLMFGQLIIAAIRIYFMQNSVTICNLFLIILVWILTFAQFVPLHQKITNEDFNKETVQQLVSRNWVRTVLWNCIFIWGLWNLYYPIA